MYRQNNDHLSNKPLGGGIQSFLQDSPGSVAAAQGLIGQMSLYPRQEALLEQTWDKPAFAIFWKPRRGKTAPTILTAQYLWEQNKIDAVLLISTQHLNWSQNEIPIWIPNSKVYEWLSQEKHFPPLWDKKQTLEPLIFFCVNMEALSILSLQEYLQAFVQKYRTMLIIDESHHLKSSRFKRTKKNNKPRARIARELAQKCPYRRILTGTPDPNGPFDYWSQFYILDPMILGPSSTKFKSRYGIFEEGNFYGRRVPILKGYQNLEELKEKIAPYVSWSEWGSEIPTPKSQKFFFEMTKQQSKIYKQLEEEFYTSIQGEQFIVDHVLTRLLRLHQLARGYFKDKAIAPLCAMEALKQVINPEEKTIVWCHFKPELNIIHNHLKLPHILISSETPKADRLKLIQQFNESKDTYILLSSPSLSGEGTDISSATHMIFYSNSYDWGEREQAIFRFQGEKQKSKQLFISDLIASHTVDLKCLSALENKKNVAESFRK